MVVLDVSYGIIDEQRRSYSESEVEAFQRAKGGRTDQGIRASGIRSQESGYPSGTYITMAFTARQGVLCGHEHAGLTPFYISVHKRWHCRV